MNHKQMFSNNDIEANNNNVTFKTNLSHSIGPAISIFAGFLSLAFLVLFLSMLITQWKLVVSLLPIAVYILIGLFTIAGITGAIWLLTRCWMWIGHAKAEWDFSRAQSRRNAIYSVGVNHVAYDRTSNVEVKQLSQRITQNYKDRDEEVIEGQVVNQTAPSFNELVRNTLVPLIQENQHLPMTKKKFVMGFVNAEPRIVEFGNIRSVAISGTQGFGKTITMFFLSLQAVLFGFRLIVIDPHGFNEEGIANKLGPLQNFFVCDPILAANPTEQIEGSYNELVRRKSSQTQDNEPICLVIDELPSIMRDYKEDAPTILKSLIAINDEGRKYGIFIIAGGQRWKQKSSGSTDLRQAFPTRIQHRNDKSEVDLFMDCMPVEAIEGSRLPKGHSMVKDSEADMLHTVWPMVENGDANTVAQLCQTFGMCARNTVEIPRNVIEMRPKEVEKQPEMTREAKLDCFREMYRQNATKEQVRLKLYPEITPGGSKGYKEFEREFADMKQIVESEEQEYERFLQS